MASTQSQRVSSDFSVDFFNDYIIDIVNYVITSSSLHQVSIISKCTECDDYYEIEYY